MIVEGTSISECWLRALQALIASSGKELSPFIASFWTDRAIPTYAGPLETDLNHFLDEIGQPRISTTASTIFPSSLTGGVDDVFSRFDKVWKYVKHDSKNRNGHYFRRMTNYEDSCGNAINQLQHILDTYNGIEGVRNPVHRRSALIATTFDPLKDHTAQPQRGFPCLQQVCFIPGKGQTLSVNAIYAMQYLSDRAYGNYLGLQRLGNFMAERMGLKLQRVNCIASVLGLGKMKKADGRELLNKFEEYV